jgi:hypothetical protein
MAVGSVAIAAIGSSKTKNPKIGWRFLEIPLYAAQ